MRTPVCASSAGACLTDRLCSAASAALTCGAADEPRCACSARSTSCGHKQLSRCCLTRACSVYAWESVPWAAIHEIEHTSCEGNSANLPNHSKFDTGMLHLLGGSVSALEEQDIEVAACRLCMRC